MSEDIKASSCSLHKLTFHTVMQATVCTKSPWDTSTNRTQNLIAYQLGVPLSEIYICKKIFVQALCGSRKHPYSPHRRDWKFRGGGGVSKTQKCKAMYEAKMEFPEGWGVIGKIPSVGGGGGGMDIFWNHTLAQH